MSDIKIISDGTSQGTKVVVGNDFINGIIKIEICPLLVGGTVTAKLTIERASLEMEVKKAAIECKDILTEERIREVLLNYQGKDSNESSN